MQTLGASSLKRTELNRERINNQYQPTNDIITGLEHRIYLYIVYTWFIYQSVHAAACSGSMDRLPIGQLFRFFAQQPRFVFIDRPYSRMEEQYLQK